jgi:branched-chain amino acid transport system ATP-binding protein
MLQVDEVTAHYGPVRALEEVSLEVPTGGIVAVLGANGAGKTSLLRTIAGLVRASSGRIRFDGQTTNLAATEDLVRRGLAYVPEGGGVIGELTVAENLRLGALWRGDREERERTLGEVVAVFPRLAERSAMHASTLSGGERQMLSIGRALISRPKLMLLDEPSLGLSPLLVQELFRLLAELNREGLALLLVEQNTRQALRLSARAYVMELGAIVMQGRPQALLDDQRLVAAYLGGTR